MSSTSSASGAEKEEDAAMRKARKRKMELEEEVEAELRAIRREAREAVEKQQVAVRKTQEAAVAWVKELMKCVKEEVGQVGVVEIMGKLSEEVENIFRAERRRWMTEDLGFSFGAECATCGSDIDRSTLACRCVAAQRRWYHQFEDAEEEVKEEAGQDIGMVVKVEEH